MNQTPASKAPAQVVTAMVRTVCNWVHNNKPVIDSRISAPAMVSDG